MVSPTGLGKSPPDASGQETSPLSLNEIMEMIYHSMPTAWKNKMIEQGFNYVNSTIKKRLISLRLGYSQEKPKKDFFFLQEKGGGES